MTARWGIVETATGEVAHAWTTRGITVCGQHRCEPTGAVTGRHSRRCAQCCRYAGRLAQAAKLARAAERLARARRRAAAAAVLDAWRASQGAA